MSRRIAHYGPSEAEERRYRAENLVRDQFQRSPQFKNLVKQAEKDMAKAEKAIRTNFRKRR